MRIASCVLTLSPVTTERTEPTNLPYVQPQPMTHEATHAYNEKRLGGQLHVWPAMYPKCVPQANLPMNSRYTSLTIIRKALRSVVASRWHTGLHPVKPDITAPCLCARLVAAVPDPGAIIKDDAWAISATRHATRAKVRAMILDTV